MIQINERYLLEADAVSRMNDLYKFFPKEGYCTTLTVRYEPHLGLWLVSGYRESSCD
jgi:hypothetical protein